MICQVGFSFWAIPTRCSTYSDLTLIPYFYLRNQKRTLKMPRPKYFSHEKARPGEVKGVLVMLFHLKCQWFPFVFKIKSKFLTWNTRTSLFWPLPDWDARKTTLPGTHYQCLFPFSLTKSQLNYHLFSKGFSSLSLSFAFHTELVSPRTIRTHSCPYP